MVADVEHGVFRGDGAAGNHGGPAAFQLGVEAVGVAGGEPGLGVGTEAEQRVAGAVAVAGFDVDAVVGGGHADVVGQGQVRGGVGEHRAGRLPGAEIVIVSQRSQPLPV
ncbi:hypothetical protein LE181_25670 [Streptomyces sp. SCA3-4]|uniref:hypothetical protein n=1 Tax=Streptomyces sichuanensis TaxID=2871810 RepID=UPI001CE33B09|nr:hypothetical protein [Streptomyces sichuanensis]MCA6095541.1 hypothetical protein [Streptomyces sichuanensis]